MKSKWKSYNFLSPVCDDSFKSMENQFEISDDSLKSTFENRLNSVQLLL